MSCSIKCETTDLNKLEFVMKRACVIPLLLLVFVGSLAAQSSQNQDQLRYIERYKDIAIREMERAGVPASIKLAQGLLESDSGRSYLARNANNHFGIKCGSNWNGKEVYRKDDDFDDQGQLIKSCFRGYRNSDASFVAHSEFLRDPRKAFRYGFLFRLDPQDYKRWAEGLRRAGYATNPRYPQLLISLIERYNLQQYDQPQQRIDDPIDIETPAAELVAGILRTNDVSYFVTDEALSVEEVARRVDLSVRRIIDYNESIQSDAQQVLPGQRVFLQPKRNSYRGKEMYHTVQAGETLMDISDRYGVKMDKLLNRNRLQSANQRIAAGERIKLRGGKVSTPPRIGAVPTPQPGVPSIPTDENGNIQLDDNTKPDTNPNTGTTVTPSPTPVPSPIPPRPPISNNDPDFGDGSTPTRPEPTTPTPTPAPPVTTPPAPTNPPVQPPVTAPTNPPVTTPQPPVTEPAPPSPAVQYYTVIKGDTLYSISRRYGTTVDKIKQFNGLTSNTISIGQRLRVN